MSLDDIDVYGKERSETAAATRRSARTQRGKRDQKGEGRCPSPRQHGAARWPALPGHPTPGGMDSPIPSRPDKDRADTRAGFRVEPD